jgi:amino acid adenylation domain-containing protein
MTAAVQSLLEAAAMRAPDKTAVVAGSRRLSYGELDAAANRLAHALSARVDVGDRVAVCLDNVAEAVIALFAVWKAGAAPLLVNPFTKLDKLAVMFADAEPGAMITSGRKLQDVAPALAASARLGTVIVYEPLPEPPALPAGVELCPFEALLAGQPATPLSLRARGDDLACLLYTSGSTGTPKGVAHCHSSLLSVTESIRTYLELSDRDVVLSVLPLAFGYGLSQMLPLFLAGGTLVLERSFTYPQMTLQKLAAEKATGFAMVPTIATMLLGNDLTKFDLSALRYVTNAGAGIAPALLAELRRRLPQTRIFPMYGQTECIRASYLPPEQVDRIPTSVGRGIPGQEMWLIDDAGRRLPNGSTGELVVAGPHVMLGYWRQPAATATKIKPGPRPGTRALHTGDLFRTDADGWFYFVARTDDIIKTRGEKVSPREVENALQALDGVQLAAVLGAPDAVLGEAVVAFVVQKPGSQLDQKAVLRHCQTHLEDFAVPKRIEFLDALPTTPNSKIDKQALRQRLEAR